MPYTMDDYIREFKEEALQILTPEERVAGLKVVVTKHGQPVEERVRGLTVEERVRGLSVEERLHGLSTEELCLLRDALDRDPEVTAPVRKKAKRKANSTRPARRSNRRNDS